MLALFLIRCFEVKKHDVRSNPSLFFVFSSLTGGAGTAACQTESVFFFCKICRKLSCLVISSWNASQYETLRMFEVCMLLLVVTSSMYCGTYFQPMLLCSKRFCCEGVFAVHSGGDCGLCCVSPIHASFCPCASRGSGPVPGADASRSPPHLPWRMSQSPRN